MHKVSAAIPEALFPMTIPSTLSHDHPFHSSYSCPPHSNLGNKSDNVLLRELGTCALPPTVKGYSLVGRVDHQAHKIALLDKALDHIFNRPEQCVCVGLVQSKSAEKLPQFV